MSRRTILFLAAVYCAVVLIGGYYLAQLGLWAWATVSTALQGR